MKPGSPNLVGNDLMMENRELHNKVATREDAHASTVQLRISAEKYVEDTKITMEQLKSKIEGLQQSLQQT